MWLMKNLGEILMSCDVMMPKHNNMIINNINSIHISTSPVNVKVKRDDFIYKGIYGAVETHSL